jgi:hypothetical protein
VPHRSSKSDLLDGDKSLNRSSKRRKDKKSLSTNATLPTSPNASAQSSSPTKAEANPSDALTGEGSNAANGS